MTAASATQTRSALTARTAPPWLWVWLGGYLLATMPYLISSFHSLIVTYFGHEGTLFAKASGNSFVTVQRLTLVFELLIYVVIVGGAVAAMFPHLRGRWVEWRFRLYSDDRPVIAEMQRFVSAYDPSISLRVTIRSDQLARLYPVGWRSARIAVFRPLPALWRRDREAAQAVLLHEVAHRRQGDQLIVGLGSPFVMLMRIWVPGYVLLVLLPIIINLASSGGALAAFTAIVTGITNAVSIPGLVFLPVTALWLAELGSDQMAARAVGADAVRQALLATAGSRSSLVARGLALLSHPPRQLRVRLASARHAGTAGLVAAWPAALVTWLVVLPAALTVLLFWLIGFPAGQDGTYLWWALHVLLTSYGRPLIIATLVLLLAWPVLASPWERLWSSAPRLSHRQPWWPYLVASSLPFAMLVLSLPSVSLPGLSATQSTTGICAQLTSWETGGGFQKEESAVLDAEQSLFGATSITPTAAQQLDSALRATIDNPPPGSGRAGYIKAMTEYETAVTDLQAGNSTAASNTAYKAETQFISAMGAVNDQSQKCFS